MEEFLTALEKRLSEMADSGYRDFQLGLIPGIQPETMVGVRTPPAAPPGVGAAEVGAGQNAAGGAAPWFL